MAPYATSVCPPELKLSRHPFVDPDFMKATVMTRINMMKPLNPIPVMGLSTRNRSDSMQVLADKTSEPSSVDGSFSNGKPCLDLFLHKDTAEACGDIEDQDVEGQELKQKVVQRCQNDPDYRFLHEFISDLFAESFKPNIEKLKQSNISDLDHDEYYCTEITDAAVGCLSMGTNFGYLNHWNFGQVVELQWKAMVEDIKHQGELNGKKILNNCLALPVCDVDYMYSVGNPEMEVLVGLTLSMSELNEEPWKGK
ncbi:hypothetical protein ACFX13_039524 [Malus domestica]